MGTVQVLYILGLGAGSAVCGKLGDRLGRKPALALAILLCSAAELLGAFNSYLAGLYTYAGTRFLAGVGQQVRVATRDLDLVSAAAGDVQPGVRADHRAGGRPAPRARPALGLHQHPARHLQLSSLRGDPHHTMMMMMMMMMMTPGGHHAAQLRGLSVLHLVDAAAGGLLRLAPPGDL